MDQDLPRQETKLLPTAIPGRLADDDDRSRITTSHQAERRSWSWLRGVTSGWRSTLILAAFSTVIVIGFNLGFLIWAVPRHHLRNGRGVLQEGNCQRVERASTGLHFLINIFSSTLLGASNYGMVRNNALASWTTKTDRNPCSNVYARLLGKMLIGPINKAAGLILVSPVSETCVNYL